jgi:serine/threonine protein kinase
MAYDAIQFGSETCLVDGDCCPEFDRWLELQKSYHRVDFRRIQRVGSGLRCLRDYDVNVSGFEERSRIGKSDEVVNEIYHRVEDQVFLFVKSIELSESVTESQMENEIENLINLRHLCIAGPIGIVFGIESDSPQELKIVRLYLEGYSLAEVLSVGPEWWTSTVKAKVVAGIVLGLRFAHSLGLLHCHLTTSNILFDSDHCIQIVDFKPMGLKVDESEVKEETKLGGFSKERWTPERDIEAFVSILFEVVFGRPTQGETSIPTGIPTFVRKIIESGRSLRSRGSYSFNTILKILKQNYFRIEDGVDSAEVSAFVSWVESTE